jgi:hypothetical protein
MSARSATEPNELPRGARLIASEANEAPALASLVLRENIVICQPQTAKDNSGPLTPLT